MSDRGTTCLAPPVPGTISEHMIRDAIKAEMKRRGWTLYQLAKESDLSYPPLYRWIEGRGDGKQAGINTLTLEKLMKALNLRMCRGSAPKRPARPRRPAK